MLDAKDPVAAYKEAEMSGLMRIEGKTVGARMKITVAMSQGVLSNHFLAH